MKTLIVAFMAVVMVGCASTKVITNTEFAQIDIPKTFQNCPVIKKSDFPAGEITNAQLHAFVLKLYKNNQLCSANMKAITDYIAKHNASVTKLNEKSK